MGRLLGGEPMDKQQVIQEWIQGTDEAMTALRIWRAYLGEWQRLGQEVNPGDLNAGLRRLRDAGLELWADQNMAGGRLDRLIEVMGVTVDEVTRLCPGCRQPVTRGDERRGRCPRCAQPLLSLTER